MTDFSRKLPKMSPNMSENTSQGMTQAIPQTINEELNLSQSHLSQWLKGVDPSSSIVRIPGDASARRYYRLQAKTTSYILMQMEAFEDQKDSLPFLVIQKHLAASGVDVPSVLDKDPRHGFILLEDLGDVTLLRKLQDVCKADTERVYYERVIDGLVQLQVFGSPKKGHPALEAFKLSFDAQKLMWEVNFTLEHFYKLYLKRAISPTDQEIMTQNFSKICTFLAGQPTVLTHRDFHSRNVMVVSGPTVEQDRFAMIDFQDARMGPPQYDLASLLKDSYYQLDEHQISMLLDYYIARYEAATSQVIDRTHFRYVFDLMSVQRNFKAIGSFASFMNRRNDATYLKYIGNTFENIRRQLIKYPEFSKLREVLFHYYYF